MYQRHEWERDDGERTSDKWILAGGRAWLSDARQTDETLPSETDIAIAALERIADGHNDARGLAVETLQAIGHRQ